jgi:hypothetical protein
MFPPTVCQFYFSIFIPAHCSVHPTRAIKHTLSAVLCVLSKEYLNKSHKWDCPSPLSLNHSDKTSLFDGEKCDDAQEPGTEFQVLMDDTFVLAVNRANPLASRDEIRWEDIDEESFIAVWKGSGNRMMIDQALARSGNSINWSYEVRHLSGRWGLSRRRSALSPFPHPPCLRKITHFLRPYHSLNHGWRKSLVRSVG